MSLVRVMAYSGLGCMTLALALGQSIYLGLFFLGIGLVIAAFAELAAWEDQQ